MKRSMLIKAVGVMCAAFVVVAALAGCASQESAATKQQSENRQYMTQVNQTMEDLQSRLDGFTDAVSRGDLVPWRMKMRTASFNNAAALGSVLPGTPVADLPAAFMSFLLVSGDLDK